MIIKSYPSSVLGTDLQTRLEMAAANSTARIAFNFGFRPTVVAPTTATRDLPGPDGSLVPAAQLQAASLAALEDLFAVVARRQAGIPD